MNSKWLPKDMKVAPKLENSVPPKKPIKQYILLINPFYPKDPNASFGKHVLTPTLALTSIAGATPPEWKVRYWDENLLQGPPPFDPFPQVVGITVHLTFAKRAYQLSKWYRERGALVVLGGLHVQSCPEEAAEHADAIVIGNGVVIWPEILKDIGSRRLKKIYKGSYCLWYKNEPTPRRDIIIGNSFLTTCSMIATRGCKNRCGFCYLSTKGLLMPKSHRMPEQVAREFAATNQPYGVFADNNLGTDQEYLWKLCRALKPINKIWSAAVSLDVTEDPLLVGEMAMAGCTGVFVGFESLNEMNLKAAKKNTPKVSEYAELVKIFHDNGIQVNGSFVFGFDNDKKDVFERTIEWIDSVKLECATFHILTPYPGTPLFRQMEKEGRLLHKNWNYYDTAHTVFRPRHMRPDELEEGYAWCYKKLFSHASIWRRRPASFSAVPPYLAMVYLYKKSNRSWHFIIKHRLTAWIWRPLIEITRIRQLTFRKKLAGLQMKGNITPNLSIISAGL
jgi:radical SAM superfamily enzyme YgiQ (UPF0313 family)